MIRKDDLLQMDGNTTTVFCYIAELKTEQRPEQKRGDIKQWAVAKILKAAQGLTESNTGLDIWAGIGGPCWRVRRGGEPEELPRVICLQRLNY